jgi:acetone carboxylase gamma subunit
MTQHDKKTLERMIEGDLRWGELKNIISGEKDADRFDKILDILQEKVSWSDKIILPLHEHLYIVNKEGNRIVKCDCGFEFGDYTQNWKIKCKIRVRDIEQSINELYPKYMGCDPNWMEIREFFCPGCYTLLETETVPSGYPVIFNFLPDIDTFYEKWLNKRVPTK